ncbi:MAG: 16S rRNA (guanine(527)-N(7))-methyltransferase RsmG [Candidatus Ornithospirochaeta sp.]
MTDNIILEGLKSFGVEKAEDKAIVLSSYLDLVMSFNPSLKLVGEKERDEIARRHILDSASAYPVFLENTEAGDQIGDLGSGAGFPGIVLAILFPDRNFVLIDRMTRRIGFLRIVKAKLNLENVEILDKDIKDVKRNFSVITCRAFRPLSEIGEEVVALTSSAILYKAVEDNIEKELETLRSQGFVFNASILPVSIPGENARRNIVVMKEWRKP